MSQRLRGTRRFAGLLLGMAALGLAAALPAEAHFLWLGVDGAPKAQAHLKFCETPEETTQAVPVARLAEARARDAAGKALALTAGEGEYSGPLAGRPAAAAVQRWGVVDRGGEGPFLLEYYAKGAADAAGAAADLKQPLEILARVDGGQVVATLHHEGKGVGGAPFHIHLPSGRTMDRTADTAGTVRFDPEGGGEYGLRARFTEDRAGQLDGKSYGEVRHYATLTFALPGGAATAGKAGGKPAAAGSATAANLTTDQAAPAPQKADPAAYALLKNAHDARQVMPADYPGFRAELVYQEGDKVYQGELIYHRQGETEVHLEGIDDKSLDWSRAQILNLVGHRRGGDFAQGDGRYPLQLGPDDGNPFGRRVEVNDASKSSYRVRDNRVLEVTRTLEGSRFTISVIQTMDADAGKCLANHFLVSYRDAATGKLQKVEGYRDGYAKVGGIWLPTSRTVIESADETTPTVRTLRIRKPEILAAAPAAAPGVQ
jgi:hypothetical protein